jgi:hypothetical protein
MATWKQNVLRAVRAFLAGGELKLPEGAHQVWEFFVDLHHTRGSSFSGAEPIRYAEIEAYGRLMQVPFQPQHVSMIRAIDQLWIEKARAVEAEPTNEAGPRPVLTAAAFDAVWG